MNTKGRILEHHAVSNENDLAHLRRSLRDIRALQSIFPNNNITRRKTHGIATLHLDTTTLKATFPLLFADCTPDAECTNQIGMWDGCHETRRFRIQHEDHVRAPLRTLIDQIQSRILFRFVDVICLFADDLGGYGKVAETVGRWIANGGDPQFRPPHKPCIIVIGSRGGDFPGAKALRRSTAFRAIFHSLAVWEDVAYADFSSLATQRLLKEALVGKADEMREVRTCLRRLYRASHVRNFFRESIKAFSVTQDANISFEEIARLDHGGNGELSTHLYNFIQQSACEGFAEVTIACFVASALLMDCFPPQMHRGYTGSGFFLATS